MPSRGEWDAQEEIVDPTAMPWTRSANAALDKVAPERAGVVAHLADYAGTDLLSYRASGPETLIARQRDGWDPVPGLACPDFRCPVADDGRGDAGCTGRG